jgi:glycosyltransferase involved in cell wall biosynthesis
VIRCGPEVELLECHPPPLPEARRLIWVGRICEEKGVPLLLEAAQQLAGENLDFELVMVGDGPLRSEVETQIRTRNLERRIVITGWLNGEEVREQIARCRALVLPSFAEGLPAVIMEALALGRPALSTYIAGIPELIEPGRNGWLVPAGSSDALAEAMREAIELPNEAIERMGRAGRESALCLHDTAAEVDKLERRIRESVES